MQYSFVSDESERKTISRTLKNFIERSNDAYVSVNEHMQKYLQVYEDDYRLCLSALADILESMHIYRDRTKIIDVKTQVMCMRIMARWFACLGASARRGNLSQDYGGIFTDARRDRKRPQRNCSPTTTRTGGTRLCMSDYTKYMIAGVCLIIAIKYQTDNSELRFLEEEHVAYLDFISSRVLEKINVYNALIFYRKSIRCVVGLPEIPEEDLEGRQAFSVRQSRFIVEQREHSMQIEMCVLGDLEWRVSEPIEVDFVELYAYLSASTAHRLIVPVGRMALYFSINH